jgi:thioredoxin-like negative regulator of GroEL
MLTQLSRYAKKFAATTDAYKVNVDEFPTAKEHLKLTEFPAVVIFKDGKEVKRIENMNPEKAKEVAELLG